MAKRDLLSLWDLGADEIRSLMRHAGELKHKRAADQLHQPLVGKTLGMIFEKASTRTRVSFEVGMYELGGHAVYLAAQGSQIGRGEPLRDTARVLAGYCHGIVIRTFGHDIAEELARFAPIPVINGLTDLSHPCQVLADLFTVWERLGPGALDPGGARFCWIGDGNNMAHSWIEAAAILGLDLSLACPEGYDPDAEVLAHARKASDWRAHIDVVRSRADGKLTVGQICLLVPFDAEVTATILAQLAKVGALETPGAEVPEMLPPLTPAVPATPVAPTQLEGLDLTAEQARRIDEFI